jgi:murein DD-endopeptidase MepM/ murein hydrolase activator NlpD
MQMNIHRSIRVGSLLPLVLVVLAFAVTPHGVDAKTADGAIRKMDRDGDGKLSRREWRRKRIFDEVDLNGDGYITREELEVRFAGGGGRAGGGGGRPDRVTLSAIRRGSHDDVRDLKERGLFETGLHPVWPDDVECRGIDHGFAMDYTAFRSKESYHGGIDIPAPFDTPVLAAMDGEVVALYEGRRNPRGIEVVLRHTPEDSGLPMVLYSRYTHFRAMPDLRPGQRVKMGDVLGMTGNTGYRPCERTVKGCRGMSRRSLLHFDILYTEDERYYDTGSILIPFGARWMDPNALYRKRPPFDSGSMRALPEEQKAVPISYRLDTGEFVPRDTKMIWPYACRRKRDAASGAAPPPSPFAF